MALAPLDPTDTRSLFRPVSAALVALLRHRQPEEFDRTTAAAPWTVRDVLAHMLDTALRRLSFHRDRMVPPPPSRPIQSERDFVDFINGLNAEWVGATKRLSPRVLTDAYDRASQELADWFESVPFDAPALFGVSWAGESTSEGWFDIGREFTEQWHHQEQIRWALGAPGLDDPRYMRAVNAIAIRGLPHAYRDVSARAGDTLVVEATGPSGGMWTLTREPDRWTIMGGEAASPTARVSLSDETLWMLLFNALKPPQASSRVLVDGARHLAEPLFAARAIVI